MESMTGLAIAALAISITIGFAGTIALFVLKGSVVRALRDSLNHQQVQHDKLLARMNLMQEELERQDGKVKALTLANRKLGHDFMLLCQRLDDDFSYDAGSKDERVMH